MYVVLKAFSRRQAFIVRFDGHRKKMSSPVAQLGDLGRREAMVLIGCIHLHGHTSECHTDLLTSSDT